MKTWEAYCLVWWLRLEMGIEQLSARLKRHEPKLFWAAFAVLLLYAYFMASVECATYGNCWVANADLADAVFQFFSMK